MSALDTDRFRSALLEERQRIAAALENLHDENPGSILDETGEETAYDQHLGDTATVMHDRSVDYTLEDYSQQTLDEIDAALSRIEDGTYGTCTNCGRQIAEERLEARPWASLCIDCARQLERG